MKTVLKILAGLVLFGVIAGGTALYLTRGVVDTAESFFEAVREGRTDEVMAQLSEGFQAASDRSALMRFLDDSELRRVESASWHSRSISGGQGRLEGTLTTESGGSVPIVLDMVKEHGAWKIHRIERTTPGLAGPAPTPVAPSTDSAVDLVRTTTRDFLISLDAGSMAYFHGTLSRPWQSQNSVAELDRAYQVFLELEADLGVLNRIDPVLETEPGVDPDGVLSVAGHYPTEPSGVRFTYRYVKEDGAWKPLGLEWRIGGP